MFSVSKLMCRVLIDVAVEAALLRSSLRYDSLKELHNSRKSPLWVTVFARVRLGSIMLFGPLSDPIDVDKSFLSRIKG